MFHVILYQPEIPPNTGNIIRLCANLGADLHLIEPLGFRLEDRLLRRAGLDYREWVRLRCHPNLDVCLADLCGPRLFALSTKSRRCYTEPTFRGGDAFLFGPETRGLPTDLLAALPQERRLRIPMQPGNRSLNLSNAVAVVLFEAWRQGGFRGAQKPADELLQRGDPSAALDAQTPAVSDAARGHASSGLGSRCNKDAVACRGDTPS